MNVCSDIDRFFNLFPEPELARDLFNILEDFRIESRLKEEYPVLGDQITDINRFMLNKRPALDDMAGDKQRAVEIIGQWLISGKTKEKVPSRLTETFEFACAVTKTLKNPRSDIHDVAGIVSELYFHIDDTFVKDVYRPVLPFSAFIDPSKTGSYYTQLGGIPENSRQKPDYDPAQKNKPPLNPDGDTEEENITPVDDPSEIPDNTLSKRREKTFYFSDLPDFQSKSPARENKVPENQKRSKRISFGEDGTRPEEKDISYISPDTFRSDHYVSPFRSLTTNGNELAAVPGSHLYPEWGNDIECYRVNWARVVEHPLTGGLDGFYQATLKKYAGLIKKVKREFQMLRPESLTKLKRQVDGEEIDLDATVEYFIDRKLGITPSEKNYIRTKKSNRDIAVAFLIDMSGSTRGATIAFEKEALIIMSEALCELGDIFSIYGFSGHTREKVDFFIIKDFLEPYDAKTARKISAIRDLHGTRIGPAIRHTHTKLNQRDEKTKMLILLSDGKPEDKGYNDAYGIEDTRMALKEGAQQGIRPFCITVDASAPEYLHRMYSHSNWVVFNDVEKLPWKITRIYRRLTT